MVIVLIRHFQTKGNEERRYVGRTDESVLRDRIKGQRCMSYPLVDQVVASPMKRCTETASYIYQGQDPYIVEELRECDFGSFEYKNYEELKDLRVYQTWLQSGGTISFPEGESPEGFRARCVRGFEKAVDFLIRCGVKHAAFVVHGGTIMSVLSAFSDSPSAFYDWMVPNGGGYVADLNETDWEWGKKRLVGIKRL